MKSFYARWPFLFKGRVGGFRPFLAMDTFCEVRGQTLRRRGDPINRARILSETNCLFQLSRVTCQFVLTFAAGWVFGFISAVVYLINS